MKSDELRKRTEDENNNTMKLISRNTKIKIDNTVNLIAKDEGLSKLPKNEEKSRKNKSIINKTNIHITGTQ